MLSSLLLPFRRNIGTVWLTLLLAGLLAYYALGYLPSREADLRRQHFRVLTRIGDNLRERILTYEKVSEGLANLLERDHLLPADTQPASLAARQNDIRRAWQQPGLNNFRAGLSFQALQLQQPARINNRQTGLDFMPAQEEKLRFIQPVWEQAATDSLHRFDLLTTLPLARLLNDLRRADVFEHFMVFTTQGEPLYTTTHELLTTSNWSLKPAKGARPDTVLLRTGQIQPITLAGRDYWLFLQPMRLDSEHTWLLAGAVPASLFRVEKMQLPSGVLEMVLALLLVGTLLLPFLKIALMGPRERLGRRDVLLCAASLVLGSGVLALAIQADTTRQVLEIGLFDRQLKLLANQTAQRLNHDIVSIRRELAEHDKQARLGEPNPNLALGQPQPLPPQPKPSADLLAWVDADGWMRYVRGFMPRYVANLRQRRYFQAMQLRWPGAAAARPFVLDAVVSYKDVNKTAILAMPGRSASFTIFASTQLPSFLKLRLPPGYSYCLIDSTGEILFHSDPRLGLSENLVQDCELNGRLQAAMFGQVADSMTVPYQGEAHRLYIEPVRFPMTDSLLTKTGPPLQPAATYTNHQSLYLVTLANLGYLSARHMQDLTLALLLMCLVWGGVFVFLGLQWLLLPRPLLQVVRPLSFAVIWPRSHHGQRYLAVGLAGMLGVGALYAVSYYVSPISQLGLCLLLPLALYLYTLWQLTNADPGTLSPLEEATSFEDFWYRRGLQMARRVAWALMLALNGLHFWLVGWFEWLWVALFMLLLIAIFFLVEWLTLAVVRLGRRLRAWSKAPKPFLLSAALAEQMPRLTVRVYAWETGLAARVQAWKPRLRLHYRFSYSLLLLAWIVILGLLPAGLCYRIAYQTERQIQVRYAHLSLLRQMPEERRPRLGSLSHGATTDLPEFFFQTHLQARPLLQKSDSATWLKRFSNARYGPHTTQLNRRLLTALHPSFAEKTQQAQNILEATYDQKSLPKWQVVNARHGQHMGSEARYPDGSSAWLVSSPQEPWASNAWLAGPAAYAWGAVLARSLFGLGLWGLLLYLIRKIFAPALVQHEPARDDIRGGHERPVLPVFVLNPGGSTLTDLPLAEYKNYVRNDEPRIIDCRQLTSTTKLPTLDAADLLVLEHFDARPDDVEATRAKTLLLRHAQGSVKARILVLSRLHPMAFTDCGHPLQQECPRPGHADIRAAGALLLDELAFFRVHYLALHGSVTRSEISESMLQKLEAFMQEECQRLAFLRKIQPALTTELRRLHFNGYRLEQSSVVLMIQRMAQFYYRSLWQMLAPQEQYVLLDLAQDGLVNARNVMVLDSLLQKGYVRLDTDGRLQVLNESFRTFILSSLRQQEALRYEQEEQREGTWAQLQLPLMLLLSAGALFVFITQRSVLNEAQTFLTILAGLVPTLLKLLPSSSLTTMGRGSTEIKT